MSNPSNPSVDWMIWANGQPTGPFTWQGVLSYIRLLRVAGAKLPVEVVRP